MHRDIKPANIYVCRMGLEYDFVKVLDFGLVKFKQLEPGRDSLATLDHTTTGTPAYMAPEIDPRRSRRGSPGRRLRARLRRLLSAHGAARVRGRHVDEDAAAAPARAARAPSERSELPIPRELDELVLACLQKDPNRRPQNAGELFQLAQKCRSCEGWGAEMAQAWWESHLPELTGPLRVGEDSSSGIRRAAGV